MVTDSEVLELFMEWFASCNTEEEIEDLVMTIQDATEQAANCRKDDIR